MFNRLFQALLVGMFLVLSVAAQNDPPKTEGKIIPVKITRKVQPMYTEEAARAKIEGSVALRVTFLSTVEIGKITYIKPEGTKDKEDVFEKYGLVNQAIVAAKQIEFIPAMRDGVPITVAKVVIYNFRL